jgi:putative ABC transport system permease protein
VRVFRLLYRAVLALLPQEFLGQHGAQALRMAARRVREESGVHRVVRGARELLDLSLAVPRLRRDLAALHRQSPPGSAQDQGGLMPNGFLSDIRYASRALRRTRGFLAVSMTTLGGGIALCTAVIVVVNAYLMEGLPYPDSDRLFWVRYGEPGAAPVQGLEHIPWRALDDVIEHPIAWDLDLFSLRGAPYPEAAQGTWVTYGFIEGFGVRPAIGRPFTPADFEPGRPSVALISHRLWQSRFGGDPGIVGRPFEAYVTDRPDEPQTFTVVGVLPESFWHLNAFTEVMAPLRAPTYPYLVRLRRGVAPNLAAERITSLARSHAAGVASVPEGWRVVVESAHERYVQLLRPLLTALAAATALVMLIACANVAVLFTVRATHRRREIAVRKALGAVTGRITRVLVSEAIVVGATATLLGVALAQVLVTVTAPLMAEHLGRSAPGGVGVLAIGGQALVGALLIGLFVTGLCSAVQIWTSSRTPVALALSGGQKSATAGPRQRHAHALLISVEVAACLTLLVGAALMLQSGLRILSVDMGLQTRDVLVGQLSLNQQRYPDGPSRSAFFDRLDSDLSALPGVRSVAFTNAFPLQAAPTRDVARDGPGIGASSVAGLMAVSPEYFAALSIALDDGRAFTSADRQGAENVAIVSRTLAAALWPGRRAIGERVRIAPPQGAPRDQPAASFVVVGVAGDVRHVHTDEALADVYVSLLQFPAPAAVLYVNAPNPAPRFEQDLRDVLARVDRDLALAVPRPLTEILDQQRAGPRFLGWLLSVFALFAAVLALVGIYGVIAYTVRQREREIAVRIAVGADRGIITRLFLRQGGAVLAMGLGLGVGGALLLGQLLESQLFGVRPADPVAIVAVTLSFALCGLIAIGWPARAAASTDPAKALKD